MAKENYVPTIGLEIHAQLNTETKMFSRSKNDPDETRPNVNVSPVDLGHPGTLPVVNKDAVKQVLRVGLAAGGEIADYTEFDRKNYFYPDIPKGYQISQYKYPLVTGGTIRGIELTRIHLEEDTGRNTHDKGDFSLVDYNRAGVPLMELVTEPVIHDAVTASLFAKELQLLLRYLGAGNANMEKGEMRVEANVSVSKDSKKLGTKVEVKNINSFKAVERAIEFEIDRQIKLLEEGGEVVQETRGWDENKQITFSQRKKESSHDYRYFPDPDIPKLKISEIKEFDQKTLRESFPELPWEKRSRYEEELGLKNEDAEMYVASSFYGDFFDRVSEILDDKKKITTASNYITSDIAGYYAAHDQPEIVSIDPQHFAKLVELLESGEISSRGAKDILAQMLEKDEDPETLAERLDLFQKSNEDDLLPIVQEILSNNPEAVAEYKAGKEASIKYLMGQGMKATKGSANPQVLEKLLKENIKELDL